MKALPTGEASIPNIGASPNDLSQIKTTLSIKIIQFMDDCNISIRQAHALTKVSPADFSRIRNGDLDRFTIDRLIKILNRLGQQVDVRVHFEARRPGHRNGF